MFPRPLVYLFLAIGASASAANAAAAAELPTETLSAIAGNRPEANCALLFAVKERAPLQADLDHLDVRQFSIDTSLYLQDESLGLAPGTLLEGIRTGKAAEVFRLSTVNLWTASLIPFEEYRRIAFDEITRFMRGSPLGSGTISEVRERLRAPIPRAGSLDLGEVDRYFAEESRRKIDLRVGSFKARAICSFFGESQSTDVCLKALDFVLGMMSPTGYQKSDKVLLDEFRNFFANERHLEPLRLLAGKMIDRVQSGEVPTTRLFEDVERTFLDAGYSRAEAYEVTWNFIGLSSTAGANIFERFNSIPATGSNRAYYAPLFGIINMAASVLDARTLAREGHFYSMPANVKASVENTKVYHFWMAAYLARKAAREFDDVEAAIDAAWLAHLGYQVFSETHGRLPRRAFMVLPFGPENNKMRLDVAYAANASVYGALSLHALSHAHFDVDHSLLRMLEAGEALPTLFTYRADRLFDFGGLEAWYRWRRIFAPDAAMRSARWPVAPDRL